MIIPGRRSRPGIISDGQPGFQIVCRRATPAAMRIDSYKLTHRILALVCEVIAVNNNMNRKSRIVYIDVLKIIAIILVVFNHTGENGYRFFLLARESFFYPAYMLISVLDKVAVPLFFMVSGVLMIPKEESYRSIILRFVRFAAILVVVSGITYFYRGLKAGTTAFSLKEFIVLLWQGKLSVPYWYLYAYLAYILMLPFLRNVAKGLDYKGAIWLFVMFGATAMLTLVDQVLFRGKYIHDSNFNLFTGLRYVFYPVIGYYLDRNASKGFFSKKLAFWGLLAASLLAIVLTVVVTHFRYVNNPEHPDSVLSLLFNSLIFIPTITIFIAVKMLFEKHPVGPRAEKILGAVSGTTFGLYLFEDILRKELLFILNAMKSIMHPYIACWLWVVLVCVLGGAVIFLIRLIPGVKKLI